MCYKIPDPASFKRQVWHYFNLSSLYTPICNDIPEPHSFNIRSLTNVKPWASKPDKTCHAETIGYLPGAVSISDTVYKMFTHLYLITFFSP